MKLCCVLIMSILVLYCDSKVFFRFRATTCGTSGKSAVKPYCYLKAYSRNNPLLNFGYTFLKAVPDGLVSLLLVTKTIKFWFRSQINLAVEHKLNADQYRTVVNYSDFPICKHVSKELVNPFITAVLNTAKEIAPEITECCTRAGEFRVANMTFSNTSFLLLWPSGDYKASFKYHDDEDSNVYNLTYSFTIKHDWLLTKIGFQWPIHQNVLNSHRCLCRHQIQMFCA